MFDLNIGMKSTAPELWTCLNIVCICYSIWYSMLCCLYMYMHMHMKYLSLYIYIYIYARVCVYIYIYIYTYIEREREGERERQINTHMSVCLWIICHTLDVTFQNPNPEAAARLAKRSTQRWSTHAMAVAILMQYSSLEDTTLKCSYIYEP